MRSKEEYLEWHEYFFALAIAAAGRSKDDSCQNGACIVDDDNHIRGIGYNGHIAGIEETKEIWQRPVKYDTIIHAELNALFNASSSVKGCRLYLYSSKGYYPCPECAKHIAQAGISKVLIMGSPDAHHIYDWRKTLHIFQLAGVEMKVIPITKDQILKKL